MVDRRLAAVSGSGGDSDGVFDAADSRGSPRFEALVELVEAASREPEHSVALETSDVVGDGNRLLRLHDVIPPPDAALSGGADERIPHGPRGARQIARTADRALLVVARSA